MNKTKELTQLKEAYDLMKDIRGSLPQLIGGDKHNKYARVLSGILELVKDLEEKLEDEKIVEIENQIASLDAMNEKEGYWYEITNSPIKRYN